MFKVTVKAWLSGGSYHLKPNLHQTCLPLQTKGNNVALPSPFSLLPLNIGFCKQTPTLQCLGSVLLDHDGELQDQLGSRLQEGLQQPQHVDVCILKHHGPVPASLVLLLTARHDPQVQRPDVPASIRVLITSNTTNL